MVRFPDLGLAILQPMCISGRFIVIEAGMNQLLFFNMDFSRFLCAITDIDECTAENHDCHLNAVCSNIQGSFSCNCIQGYTGDGKQCAGLFLFLQCVIVPYLKFDRASVYVPFSLL